MYGVGVWVGRLVYVRGSACIGSRWTQLMQEAVSVCVHMRKAEVAEAVVLAAEAGHDDGPLVLHVWAAVHDSKRVRASSPRNRQRLPMAPSSGGGCNAHGECHRRFTVAAQVGRPSLPALCARPTHDLRLAGCLPCRSCLIAGREQQARDNGTANGGRASVHCPPAARYRNCRNQVPSASEVRQFKFKLC